MSCGQWRCLHLQFHACVKPELQAPERRTPQAMPRIITSANHATNLTQSWHWLQTGLLNHSTRVISRRFREYNARRRRAAVQMQACPVKCALLPFALLWPMLEVWHGSSRPATPFYRHLHGRFLRSHAPHDDSDFSFRFAPILACSMVRCALAIHTSHAL